VPCEPERHLAAWPRGRRERYGDSLRDGWETSGRGDRVITDKLVPFDLQQLSLVLQMESLKGSV